MWLFASRCPSMSTCRQRRVLSLGCRSLRNSNIASRLQETRSQSELPLFAPVAVWQKNKASRICFNYYLLIFVDICWYLWSFLNLKLLLYHCICCCCCCWLLLLLLLLFHSKVLSVPASSKLVRSGHPLQRKVPLAAHGGRMELWGPYKWPNMNGLLGL